MEGVAIHLYVRHCLMLFFYTLERLSNFKPHYYRGYVDDIFALFTSPEQLKAFQNCPNGRHANKSFTIGNEKQKRMSFLDVQIIHEDKTFTTSVYCKL